MYIENSLYEYSFISIFICLFELNILFFTIDLKVLLTHAETGRAKMLRLKINKFTYIVFNVVSKENKMLKL